MDETKTRCYRWSAENAKHFPWILWGAVVGAFLLVVFQGADVFHMLHEHTEDVIAAFTIVLAISTIGLWIATRRLWKAGEKQIELTGIAAMAAQTSAEASQAALKHAEQTAVRQLRAYVTITKHKALHFQMVVGHTIVHCVTITNRGQTPANDVTITLMAQYELTKFAETLPITPDPSASFTLAPGEKFTQTADLPALDQHTINDLANGTKVLILLGEVQYKDAFGNDRRTRMRAKSNKDSPPDANLTLQLEWFGSDNDAT